MTETRLRLEPGPDHPITIQRNAGHVSVRSGTAIIAETDRALELRESNYPPVLYIPLGDVDQQLLKPSDQHTYCPYKGEASYYDVLPGDGDAVSRRGLVLPRPIRCRRSHHATTSPSTPIASP